MFRPKLIVTDLDGTALRNDKTISEKTINAFAQCKKQGIPVAIATARYILGARPYARLLHANYQILTDGTLIYENEHLIYSNAMDIPTTNKMLEALKRYQSISHIAIPTVNGLYRYPEVSPDAENEYLIDINKPFAHPANKLVAEIPDSSIAEKIAAKCHCRQLRYRGENRYTFFHPSASKLSAIEFIAKRLNISLSDILVFGDDSNDMEMITHCGYSVAMGNALGEVKAAASEVTDTNEADGVAKVLFRFFSDFSH